MLAELEISALTLQFNMIFSADETIPVNAMSTPIMEDDDYEDCIDEDEEEEEGEEVGAEVTAGDPDRDLMSSDAPYSTTSGNNKFFILCSTILNIMIT